MSSTRATRSGLALIKQSILKKGWRIYDERWLVEASKILEPGGHWGPDGPYAYGCSLQTWERFLKGTAIRDRSFNAFCHALEIAPQTVANRPGRCCQDWGQAPDVPAFHGREKELETLEKWIVRDRCKLINISGFAGSGKTRLVSGGLTEQASSPWQLGNRVRDEFDCLIWRRVESLSPNAMLSELILFIKGSSDIHLSETTAGLVTQLLSCLRQRRCLVVIDNVDSILSGGAQAGQYRQRAEDYGRVLRQLGESSHRSCVVLVGRESLRDIEGMEGVYAVRSLQLQGLDTAAAQAVFQRLGQAYDVPFHGFESDWQRLVSLYGGNPLMLEAVARRVYRRFDGSLSKFLAQKQFVFGKVRSLLDWHFDRLSESQKEILYWISVASEPISLADLSAHITSPQAQKCLLDTLDGLERQIPIGRVANRLMLPGIFAEYMCSEVAFPLKNRLVAFPRQSFEHVMQSG